jgi:hypothetical protein
MFLMVLFNLNNYLRIDSNGIKSMRSRLVLKTLSKIKFEVHVSGKKLSQHSQKNVERPQNTVYTDVRYLQVHIPGRTLL